MSKKTCNKCKGVRPGPLGNVHPSPSVGNLPRDRSSSSSSPSIPVGLSVGGPESGDRRERVRKNRNLAAEKNVIQENTSEEDAERVQGENNLATDDEEATLGNKWFGDYNENDYDVGSNALTRSVYVFGVVLLIAMAFGYAVALSNTGRIQVLEKEIREMKEGWNIKNGLSNDPSTTSSGWFSGRGFGNFFGLWESPVEPPVAVSVDNAGVGSRWYDNLPLIGSRNSTKTLN